MRLVESSRTIFLIDFGVRRDSQSRCSWSTLLKNKPPIDLSRLETPFSKEELKKSTFDLGADKALGPD